MVKQSLPKPRSRVRFPYPAPKNPPSEMAELRKTVADTADNSAVSVLV